MSVSRKDIAEVAGVSEDRVKCATCDWSKTFINDSYTCQLWHHGGILPKDAFCSFWRGGGVIP